MRLRTNLTRPQKLEDEIACGNYSKDPTKPAFPHLQQSQVVPFNPNLPSAAFPTLSASTDGKDTGSSEAPTNSAADAGVGYSDDYETIVDESMLTNSYPQSRQIPTVKSPLDLSFEDQIVSSDEEDQDARREQYDQHSHTTQDEDNKCLEPKTMASDTIHWKELSPAIQLAIISQLSDQHPVAKVYDMLGLYAQDVGDFKRIAAEYNHQREMEASLISWMQQDQLNGILRTDHTLALRGAVDAYQQFQTQNYMKKVQAEIDESLLQATRAQVHLGEIFLAQQGIQRGMVGFWEHISGYTKAKFHYDHEVHGVGQPVLARSGLDSGYASSTISTDKMPRGKETVLAIASRPQTITRTGQQTERKKASRPRNAETPELHQAIDPPKGHRDQHHSTNPHCCSPDSAEDASTVGSSGRSRRIVRRSSRYNEAIAELKLRGSGGEPDDDYEMSDDDGRGSDKSEDSGAPRPSSRLRITFNNRTVRVSASSSSPTVTRKATNTEAHESSDVPHMPPLSASGGHVTTPKTVASPLPLQRVVVRPPKNLPEAKQSNVNAGLVKGSTMNEHSQKLFPVPRAGNEFTKFLLTASQRDTASATPWVLQQPTTAAKSAPPVMVDQRRRSGTFTAPAFSPITEDFPSSASQDAQRKATALQSPETFPSKRMSLYTDAAFVKGTLRLRQDFSATSEPHYSTCNDRSLVTESGSPTPCRRMSVTKIPTSAANGITRHNRGVTLMPDDEDALTCRPATGHPTFSMTNISRSLDPVSGNVIVGSQQAPHATSPTHKLQPPASPSISPVKSRVAPPKSGEKVKKAAANLRNITAEITRSNLLAKQAVAAPNNNEGQLPSKQSNSPATTAEVLKQKRKYVKSEAQRRKEMERKEKRQRERARPVGKAKQVVVVQEPESDAR